MVNSLLEIIHVTQKSWELVREREREDDIHSCTHWNADECMCKGACSCHWEVITGKYVFKGEVL